ncbi:azobenzene reductase [Paenibacillus sp. 4624]|jgi:azobenzene reductase|uniref:NAD(P)H-dependent oxidoreductase n=1 Tax=Paenibacillus amylolyticus TaxID=1451 RepID=A0A5M9WNX3_PAEAM|nr:NADPH-dependent FMN reductase [Paenibacillus amylolyticus]KAA8783300.1 NAD(P)H-dependent oxidoreductase [Paenibacillus amylolyticus]
MNIVILAGSNRRNATSTRLGEYAAEIIQRQGHEASLFNLYEKPLPFYAPDEKQDTDENLVTLNTAMLAADAIILSTPEYHGSISGVLKNALDHLSQAHFSGKSVLSISSAGGAVGVSSLTQMQTMVRNLHGINAPEWISIGGAQRRRFEATFDGYEEYEGSQDIEERVQRVLGSFLNLAQTLTAARSAL